MKTYLFQIREQGKGWEQTKRREAEFETREQAVAFAYSLSELFQTEVRLTNHLNGNGCYIMSKKVDASKVAV